MRSSKQRAKGEGVGGGGQKKAKGKWAGAKALGGGGVPRQKTGEHGEGSGSHRNPRAQEGSTHQEVPGSGGQEGVRVPRAGSGVGGGAASG